MLALRTSVTLVMLLVLYFIPVICFTTMTVSAGWQTVQSHTNSHYE